MGRSGVVKQIAGVYLQDASSQEIDNPVYNKHEALMESAWASLMQLQDKAAL